MSLGSLPHEGKGKAHKKQPPYSQKCITFVHMESEKQKMISITPPSRYQNMSAAGFFLSLLSVLIMVGIFMNEQMGSHWISNFALAFLIGLAGLAMLTTHGGVKVDVQNRRVRHYSKTLGLQTGKWQSIEELKHISVVRYKQDAKLNFLSISYHQQSKPVHLRLNLGGRQYVQLLRADYSLAWPHAVALSESLQVPIFRWTGPGKEWLAPGGQEPLEGKPEAQE